MNYGRGYHESDNLFFSKLLRAVTKSLRAQKIN